MHESDIRLDDAESRNDTEHTTNLLTGADATAHGCTYELPVQFIGHTNAGSFSLKR